MASDIVPELLSDVQNTFEENVNNDTRLIRIANRIRDGTATLDDAHYYAEYLGENLSDAFNVVLQPGVLPDDRMYYNIANRTVDPLMRNNFRLINKNATDIQKHLYELEGLGINPLQGEFPVERVAGLIDKITESETLMDVLKWLAEPLINTSISFYDDWMRENVDFQEKAGMRPKIVRKLGSHEVRTSKKRKYSVPCSWCQNLAGEYDYSTAPAEVYQRHESCRCIVTFHDSGKVQDVWSKKVWQASGDTLNARARAGLT